jgi:2,3-bisphosphoglycerate-dependent phosphoglycerate mutase
LDKQETVNKHGKEQVLVWRRSFDIPPPEVDLSRFVTTLLRAPCATCGAVTSRSRSEYYPGNDRRYASLPKHQIPRTESLKITAERVLPYWQVILPFAALLSLATLVSEIQSEIVPVIASGKTVLVQGSSRAQSCARGVTPLRPAQIAAHGNSLRALVMHLDNISKDEITELNIPTGSNRELGLASR